MRKKYINIYEIYYLKINIIENNVKFLHKHVKLTSKLSDNPTIPLQANIQRNENASAQTCMHVQSLDDGGYIQYAPQHNKGLLFWWMLPLPRGAFEILWKQRCQLKRTERYRWQSQSVLYCYEKTPWPQQLLEEDIQIGGLLTVSEAQSVLIMMGSTEAWGAGSCWKFYILIHR